jgi:serine/threonine protein kinase
VKSAARCPDCGRAMPSGASPIGFCPFCLLQLGLDVSPLPASPWIDPQRTSYQLLGALNVEHGTTSYLAEQEAPTCRLVVLTTTTVALEAAGNRARVEPALRALIAFEHPLVERVFGGLVAGSGIVYLVTEHVPGTPLLLYCERVRLDQRRRAALCRSAVDAIRAAHEHSIVHGALTPERLIVTTRRGEVAPVVTGFGAALGGGATVADDVASLAAVARLLGLPMPERLAGTAATLADALGVLTV